MNGKFVAHERYGKKMSDIVAQYQRDKSLPLDGTLKTFDGRTAAGSLSGKFSTFFALHCFSTAAVFVLIMMMR